MTSNSIRSQKTNTPFSVDDFLKALDQNPYKFEKGKVITGKAESYTNDGAFIDIGAKSSAFLPRYEISIDPDALMSEIIPLNMEREFLIIQDANEDGQFTVSIKQIAIKQAWDNFKSMEQQNISIQGRVIGVNKGGVNIDIQGVKGFIPRSHLLERDNLEKLVGQYVTATFLEVNQTSHKLILSQRLATQSTHFASLELGQLVEGKITGIKSFGLFIDVNGMTGLIHIKEISQNFTESIVDSFSLGQTIKAMIINLDQVQKRVSLSTKDLENYPGEMLDKMEVVMSSAETRWERAKTKRFG